MKHKINKPRRKYDNPVKRMFPNIKSGYKPVIQELESDYCFLFVVLIGKPEINELRKLCRYLLFLLLLELTVVDYVSSF